MISLEISFKKLSLLYISRKPLECNLNFQDQRLDAFHHRLKTKPLSDVINFFLLFVANFNMIFTKN